MVPLDDGVLGLPRLTGIGLDDLAVLGDGHLLGLVVDRHDERAADLEVDGEVRRGRTSRRPSARPPSCDP